MLTNAVNLLGIEYQRHASSISLAWTTRVPSEMQKSPR
jgi:hypothetical protein